MGDSSKRDRGMHRSVVRLTGLKLDSRPPRQSFGVSRKSADRNLAADGIAAGPSEGACYNEQNNADDGKPNQTVDRKTQHCHDDPHDQQYD
jgi:hypothetical protein